MLASVGAFDDAAAVLDDLAAGADDAVARDEVGRRAVAYRIAIELMRLPMFPLGSALVPFQLLPLQVFEPRYRELVADCRAGDGRFGVVVIERRLGGRWWRRALRRGDGRCASPSRPSWPTGASRW